MPPLGNLTPFQTGPPTTEQKHRGHIRSQKNQHKNPIERTQDGSHPYEETHRRASGGDQNRVLARVRYLARQDKRNGGGEGEMRAEYMEFGPKRGEAQTQKKRMEERIEISKMSLTLFLVPCSSSTDETQPSKNQES